MLQIKIDERIRAEEILKRLSSQDGLTGIANRRYFDKYVEREWRRAIRDNSPIALIICDIDFFKAYNDTYGHQRGDDCLKKIAEVISNAINRPGDMVARYGGEEFVVVLTNTDIKGASFVAEAIRKKVEAMGILHESSSISKVVTISLGVTSTIPGQNTSPDGLIIAADEALYQAKQGGRNRVVISTRM